MLAIIICMFIVIMIILMAIRGEIEEGKELHLKYLMEILCELKKLNRDNDKNDK